MLAAIGIGLGIGGMGFMMDPRRLLTVALPAQAVLLSVVALPCFASWEQILSGSLLVAGAAASFVGFLAGRSTKMPALCAALVLAALLLMVGRDRASTWALVAFAAPAALIAWLAWTAPASRRPVRRARGSRPSRASS